MARPAIDIHNFRGVAASREPPVASPAECGQSRRRGGNGIAEIGMLRTLAAALVLVCSSAAAWADAASDCEKGGSNWQLRIRGCSAVIAQEPGATWAYITRSYAYERDGQYERALADGNRAVELDPQHPMAHINRAAAYIGLGDYTKAISDTERAIELDPQSAVAFVNRAYAYEQLGARERAIADYRRALEIDRNFQFAKDALKRLGATR